MNAFQKNDDYVGRRKVFEELYKDVKGADVNEELMADLVVVYLFTDEAFIRRLSTENKNLFEKIFDEIKYLARLATAGSKEARELERVKRLFEKVYKESAKTKIIIENGVRYSLSDINKITPSKIEVESNIQEVAEMPSVYSVDQSKLVANGKDFKEVYGEYFAEWGENIHSEIFGDISTKKSSIRSEIRHGSTKEKLASIEAIPSVIQNGKIVDWIEKAPGLYRVIVAAPIKIGDTPYFMGVMLQRDSQAQRLYLHDVAIQKETSSSAQDNLVTTRSHAETEGLYTTSILQKIANVKSQKKFSLSKENASSPIAPLLGYNVRGEDITLKTAPLAKNTDGVANTKAAAKGVTEGKNQPTAKSKNAVASEVLVSVERNAMVRYLRRMKRSTKPKIYFMILFFLAKYIVNCRLM